jgi:hypothetical protein
MNDFSIGHAGLSFTAGQNSHFGQNHRQANYFQTSSITPSNPQPRYDSTLGYDPSYFDHQSVTTTNPAHELRLAQAGATYQSTPVSPSMDVASNPFQAQRPFELTAPNSQRTNYFALSDTQQTGNTTTPWQQAFGPANTSVQKRPSNMTSPLADSQTRNNPFGLGPGGLVV